MDVCSSIEQLEALDIRMTDEPANATALQTRVWTKEIDNAVRRINILSQNLKTLYLLVWGQCSSPMRAKVESLDGYDAIKRDTDGIALLIGIKNICFEAVEANKYKPQTMHENLRRFYHFKQDKFMTESEYLEKFKTLVEICDSVGCDLGEFNRNADNIIRDTGADPDLADDASKTATMLMAKDQYLAIAFILSASREKNMDECLRT